MMAGLVKSLNLAIFLLMIYISEAKHVQVSLLNGEPGIGPGYKTNEYQPEQIHLSYNGDPTTMVVTWMTKEKVDSVFKYGLPGASLSMSSQGTATKFETGDRKEYVHRATASGLTPGEKYEYVVGSRSGWSDLETFTAIQDGTDWSPRLAVYGDMGLENARALERLQLDTEMGMFDAVLHVGDFAYDMDDDDGKVGDEFMRMIEPIAAHVPYMTVAGNHEKHDNFSEYKGRFTMPGDSENHFYTFDMGPVRFVAISSEFYYYLEYGTDMAKNQYKWLTKTLEEADTPEARAEHPWLVVYSHRPMYCSHFVDDRDCMLQTDLFRVGIPDQGIQGVEPLLMKYGVDLAIWGHVHAYERLYPVFDNVVYNGTAENPYLNPGAPVHIITGSAGAESHGVTPKEDPADWSAYRSIDYGYTRITFHNSTHVSLNQVSEDKDGAIIDGVWIQKDQHLPYSQLTPTSQGYIKL